MPRIIAHLIAARIAHWEKLLDRLGAFLRAEADAARDRRQ
jgi:hypothetical protein